MKDDFRYFAVTTAGLTATRWLSYVLASHADVFVAHGKCPLDSIMAGDFRKEKETANFESLTRGNQTRDFYETRSLEEVLSLYRGIKPGASAYGCVHSYIMHTLAQAAQHPHTLADMRIINVVRHPVDFIASHEALVRSAEKHPRLYQHYLDVVFPQVLQQYPELYLLKCPDYRSFFAFALSCHAVNNLLLDLCYPGIRSMKMETLTTDLEVLREFCRELTGLDYSSASLQPFLRLGPINQHQAGNIRRHPHQTYAAWEPWQQDMAHIIIAGPVLDWLETLGYDLAMFRAQPVPESEQRQAPQGERRGVSPPVQAPCLADCLRSLDQRHSLLAYMTPTGPNYTQIILNEIQGFQLTNHEGNFYALARSLEIQDIATLTEENLEELQDDGLCVRGNSAAEIWWAVARLLSSSSQLIEEYHGYNLVMFREVCYAALKGFAMDFERLKSRERRQLIKENKLIVGETPANVKAQIDAFLQSSEEKKKVPASGAA